MARNQGSAVITGAWSVQLYRGGFHVNHFHHQGWISSAYYVSVPDEVKGRRLQIRLLKSESHALRRLAQRPSATCSRRRDYWSCFRPICGTAPNAIQGSQVRTTIAFDAVPNQVA